MAATLDQILTAVPGSKLSRDGQSVIVSYGSDGYLRLTCSSVYAAGTTDEIPAVAISGRLARRDGARQSDLRSMILAAGLAIR